MANFEVLNFHSFRGSTSNLENLAPENFLLSVYMYIAAKNKIINLLAADSHMYTYMYMCVHNITDADT